MTQHSSSYQAFTRAMLGATAVDMNYTAHYERLIDRARNRTMPHPRQAGAVERHHAIPKCMGGRETKENIVELTPREHFVAHLLLAKANPENSKLAIAAFLMGNSPGNKRGSRVYSKLREQHSKSISQNLLGWKHTPEMRAKVSAAHKGKIYGPETRARISAARRGTKMPPRTKEQCAAISARQLGRKGPPRSAEHREAIGRANRGVPKKKIQCPHCGFTCAVTTAKRWHFDGCKKAPK
jgi:hypothetical protein